MIFYKRKDADYLKIKKPFFIIDFKDSLFFVNNLILK
jgi:hypothetical protein